MNARVGLLLGLLVVGCGGTELVRADVMRTAGAFLKPGEDEAKYRVPTATVYGVVSIEADHAGGKTEKGTGFMLAPDVVVTARHVLRRGSNGPQAIRLTMYPGGLPVHAAAFAYLPGDEPNADVAVVLVDGKLKTELLTQQPNASGPYQIVHSGSPLANPQEATDLSWLQRDPPVASYEALTKAGVSGSPIIATSTTNARLLVGFHCAGSQGILLSSQTRSKIDQLIIKARNELAEAKNQ